MEEPNSPLWRSHNKQRAPGFLKSFPGGQSAAEFSSNPDQTHLPVIF